MLTQAFFLIPWNWEELFNTKTWKLIFSKRKEAITKKLVIWIDQSTEIFLASRHRPEPSLAISILHNY